MGREAVRVPEERVVLDGAGLRELRERLARTRLSAFRNDGWDRGVPQGWLLDLLEDWRAFDFGAMQDRLDGLTHLRAEVDGQSLHLYGSPGPALMPCRCC
jgi:epoxide hydrolase